MIDFMRGMAADSAGLTLASLLASEAGLAIPLKSITHCAAGGLVVVDASGQRWRLVQHAVLDAEYNSPLEGKPVTMEEKMADLMAKMEPPKPSTIELTVSSPDRAVYMAKALVGCSINFTYAYGANHMFHIRNNTENVAVIRSLVGLALVKCPMRDGEAVPFSLNI